MYICRSISCLKARRDFLNFGHWSWTGTPFGSSVDNLIPQKNLEKKKSCRKQEVPFKMYTVF